MNETEKTPQETNEQLVQPITPAKKITLPKNSLIIIMIFVVIAGGITGFLLAQKQTGLSLIGGKAKVIQTEKIVGSTDTKAFPDTAEGTLEKGGIDGEGTHKLIMNPKDPSQTAYLTSSVVNLDDFVGKKVRVHGQTFSAQKAGWLLDVGQVEIIQ
ncbi:MAG: hypothetical protein V1858_03670 [Candidatus Gottesmanbacteria bacterium]